MSAVHDPARLAALASYDILDTLPEEGFDDIVQLARQLCGAPVALVSLVAADRQWFKARAGFPFQETALDASVCAHALGEPDLLVIADLTGDPRTRANPLVVGDPFIRFYAGAPLRTESGDVLGSLCVIDTEPRPTGLTGAEADALRRLARQVVSLLELRRAVRQREAALSRQHLLLLQHRALLDTQQAVNGLDGDLAAVFETLVGGVMRALPQAEGGAIALIDGLDLVDHAPRDPAGRHGNRRVSIRGSLAGRSVMTGRPLLIADVRAEADGITRESPGRLGLRSCLVVPIARFGQAMGVLELWSGRPEAFGEDDLQVARLFAGEAVTGLAETGEADALKAVQDSEGRYRSVFDSITDFALIVTDRGGTVTGWNTGAERILGWSRGEMRDQDVERIFTPEDRAVSRARTEMTLSLEEGRAPDERWHLRHDGSRFWSSGEMMPLRDGEGHHHGFVKVLRDRTAEHLAGRALESAEARLRESEDHHRHTVELNPAVPWTCDPEGNITSYSGRWLDLTGQAPGEPDGAGWIKALHPDDVAPVSEVFAVRLASGEPVDVDYRIRVAATGDYRWMRARAYPRRNPDGSILRWYGVVEDVHDRRTAEARLRESEASYRTLAADQRALSEALVQANATLEQRVEERTRDRDRLWRLSTDVMLVGSFDGRIEAVNPAWTALFGWRTEELVGVSFIDFVHPDDVASTVAEVGNLARGVTTLRFENRYRHRDGSYRWLSWTAVPDERFIHAIGRDIQAEKEAAETLRITEEALRQSQKMEAVGQLTGGLAHDFNNLLTAITGGLDLLKTRMAQGRTADANRYIDMAQGAAKRAAALTHRLLAFSRRQTLAPEATNVNRLLGGFEELIRRTVGPEIRVETVTDADLWNTLVDPSQLENAVLNLCINARDAMPAGGTIVIETGNRTLDPGLATRIDLAPGRYVTVSVSDDGTGMTHEVVARAFDPFFTTKPLGAGTGLGLSMIYGFARQSGGQAVIESELGTGTRICLYLPRHIGGQEQVPVTSEATSLPRARQGETVLVVDDETSVRMVVADVLGDLGYTALEAADGAAGLAILRSGVHIDLLVTDVGLPGGLNGRQVADAARELRPGLKVLFITGYAETAVLSHGRLDPGMHILTKPFAIDALADRMRSLIEG